MSQYDNLKATIALNVYENHRNQVTANMVKAAMNAMVDSLGAGYQYLGIATPNSAPGTPDQRVFYIAAQPGTYTNFSGLVVNDGEVAVLKWDTAWHKEVTGAATAAQVTELGQYIENPVWVKVVTDSEDKILYGVKTDGKFYFGDGCPPQVVEYIQDRINELSLDEYEDIVTFLGDLIDGDTLATLLNAKLDKEGLDAEALATVNVVENSEYMQVTTDSEDKILEGITSENTRKVFCRTEHKEIEVFKKPIIGITQDTRINGIQNGDIALLKDKVYLYEEMFARLSNVPASETHDTQTFDVEGGKKVLITLHKRANNGYDTDYSAFLPNSRNDFSDVRITASGKTLPFQFLFKGNIDIIPDSRVVKVSDSLILFDGSEYILTRSNTVYRTADFINYTPLEAFSELSTTPKTMFLSNNNRTLFVGIGYKMYRSVYPFTTKDEVLDVTELSGVLRGEDMAEFNGSLYYGHYQSDKIIWIERSDDDGVTWQTVYREDGKYQHVHQLFVDTYTNTLYAGLDGVGSYRGGILKTTDGVNWTNLRDTNPNIPYSTDYGVIFANANMRLLGGETSIVGGHTLIKTTDDVHFSSILSTGKGCYWVRSYNGILLGCLLSSECHRDAQIIISYDNGETWHTAYITPNMLNIEGASDGYRWYTIGDNEFIAQGQACTSLRIKTGNEAHYAQILVDVPEDIDTITVEDGYFSANSTILYDTDNVAPIIGICRLGNALSVEVDDNEELIPIYSSDKPLYNTFGSYLSDYHRKVGTTGFLIPEAPIKVKKTLPSNFHIGFYLMNIGELETRGGDIVIINDGINSISKIGNNLAFNNVLDNNSLIAGVKDSWDRIDINVLDNTVELYINGKPKSSKTISMTFSDILELCYGYDNYVADFEITRVLSASDIQDIYFSNIIGKI